MGFKTTIIEMGDAEAGEAQVFSEREEPDPRAQETMTTFWKLRTHPIYQVVEQDESELEAVNNNIVGS